MAPGENAPSLPAEVEESIRRWRDLDLGDARGRVCQGGVRETDAIRASIDSFTLLR